MEPFSYKKEPLRRKSVGKSCFDAKYLIELKFACPGLYPTFPTCTHNLLYDRDKGKRGLGGYATIDLVHKEQSTEKCKC